MFNLLNKFLSLIRLKTGLMATNSDIVRIKYLASAGRSLNEINRIIDVPRSTIYYHFRNEVGKKQRQITIPSNEENLGDICGVFAGDGNLFIGKNSHYRIRIFLNYSCRYSYFLNNFLTETLGKEPRKYDYEEKGLTILDYYSRDLMQMFKKFLSWKKNQKSSTVNLRNQENLTLEFGKGFLRGLLDTDGYRETKFRRYIYGSISKNLRDDFSFILNSLNIEHVCYKEVPQNSDWKNMYKVRISGNSSEKMMKTIQPRNPKRIIR